MQRLLVRGQDATQLPIIPVLGYSSKQAQGSSGPPRTVVSQNSADLTSPVGPRSRSRLPPWWT
jgi:hypothetical protein